MPGLAAPVRLKSACPAAGRAVSLPLLSRSLGAAAAAAATGPVAVPAQPLPLPLGATTAAAATGPMAVESASAPCCDSGPRVHYNDKGNWPACLAGQHLGRFKQSSDSGDCKFGLGGQHTGRSRLPCRRVQGYKAQLLQRRLEVRAGWPSHPFGRCLATCQPLVSPL